MNTHQTDSEEKSFVDKHLVKIVAVGVLLLIACGIIGMLAILWRATQFSGVTTFPTPTLIKPLWTPTETLPLSTLPPIITGTPTSTPTGTAIPTSTPEAPSCTTSIGMNVRGGPGTDYPIVGERPTNETVSVVGQHFRQDVTWWKIGEGVWISGKYCIGNSTAETVEFVPAPPTPVPPTLTPTPIPTNTPTLTPTPTIIPLGRPGWVGAVYVSQMGGVNLGWGKVVCADGYSILRSEDCNESPNWPELVYVKDTKRCFQGVCSFVDTNVEKGKTYRYVVVARRGEEVSDPSPSSEESPVCVTLPSEPTPTPTFTPIPTFTPTSTPVCAVAIHEKFTAAYEQLGGFESIGCPENAVEFWAVEQTFQFGRMVWWKGYVECTGHIHVLRYDKDDSSRGDWKYFHDTYCEGTDPEYPCQGDPLHADPPLGPKRGFGMLWCQKDQVREAAGRPVAEEWGDWGIFQRFENAMMLWTPRSGVIAILKGDRWQRFE